MLELKLIHVGKLVPEKCHFIHKTLFENIHNISLGSFLKKSFNTVRNDGLTLFGARPSADTVMTKSMWHVYRTRCLTHWDWDKITAISQTTFLNALSWMKMYEFQIRFHWCLFLSFDNNISALVKIMAYSTNQTTSHYLNQWLLVYWCIYVSLELNESIGNIQNRHIQCVSNGVACLFTPNAFAWINHQIWKHSEFLWVGCAIKIWKRTYFLLGLVYSHLLTSLYWTSCQGICKKLGTLSTGQTYKLLLSFTVISDVHRSFIPNKTTFTKSRVT